MSDAEKDEVEDLMRLALHSLRKSEASLLMGRSLDEKHYPEREKALAKTRLVIQKLGEAVARSGLDYDFDYAEQYFKDYKDRKR